ncbi:hypothetical protein V6N11_070723 [Hibiscus sabdariffa]|uniref:Uncharacterized protein n=1 Tax=Hibiscus sabdariffa TaxID=183260 RepID=A0ABR2QFV2_9ROSI
MFFGAFYSMKNGILTSNSADNSGPVFSLISDPSPWSLSVAASTIDNFPRFTDLEENFGLEVAMCWWEVKNQNTFTVYVENLSEKLHWEGL